MSTKELAQITPEATINEITSVNKQAAELLKSIGLSLSEHENETLQSICQQRQWSEVEVLKWIKKHSSPTNGEQSKSHSATPDERASLKKWSKYLKDQFIGPNLELLEELTESFPRIYKVHGIQYSWLKDVEWHFDKFKEALVMYYEFERKSFCRLPNVYRKTKEQILIMALSASFNNHFPLLKKIRIACSA